MAYSASANVSAMEMVVMLCLGNNDMEKALDVLSIDMQPTGMEGQLEFPSSLCVTHPVKFSFLDVSFDFCVSIF